MQQQPKNKETEKVLTYINGFKQRMTKGELQQLIASKQAAARSRASNTAFAAAAPPNSSHVSTLQDRIQAFLQREQSK